MVTRQAVASEASVKWIALISVLSYAAVCGLMLLLA